MKKCFIVLLLIIFVQAGIAQRIDNVKATADGDFVHITYELVGEFAEQTYNVKLYSSKDEYAKPLQFIEGDVNRSNITPGSRKITFDAKKEFQSFEGEVKFRIVANVVSEFHVINPPMGLVTKRGKIVPIAWEGFRPGASVNIDLYVDNVFVANVATNVTGNTFEWKVSKKAKYKKECNLRVTDSRNKNAYAQSNPFSVKRKIPLVVPYSTLALIGGGAAYWFLKPEVFDPLPDPPSPAK